LYRQQQARSADEIVADIREAGGVAEAWEADLANPAVIGALYDRVEAALGPVEILVNNAAHAAQDTFVPPAGELANQEVLLWSAGPDLITSQSHDRHFAVNSRAVALMMAEFARRHVARGAGWGRIVNISTDGASAFASEVSYGASKHAMESYSRSAAQELGQYGVTVNIVSPGPVQTGWITPELEDTETSRIPMRRVGQPGDIAGVVLFFASEQAGWITGQLLYVGGGHVMPL
jgi:3-oxoacyl-[acyl-carrier protein] reductase